ncbi:CBS domain-containing protein [Halapricum desulfuricans]|uniref:Zinc metalloprotease n=1 Tax=Halapricum desulfuricans TaxID=2841257 RepID=A0A897NN14_9EURY|nr:CBS domain-containing protein [Halapricum desulfuricans]QSG08656.1 Zn-dependent protease fused to CBS domain [Halapricum desulfuricans]QSG11606.1 Zn-dependent protease fused to CBS domain [Halapricum desulfuricans]
MPRFRIGSAFGIPIQLDLTFLIVLPLFAWIIGVQVGETAAVLNDVWGAGLPIEPLEGDVIRWVLGLAAATGLFVGVVLHELGHSLVAIRYGYPISSITLWLFGGIAQLDEMPEDWRHELLIALAGPIVSVALGVLSYLAFLAVPASSSVALASGKFLLGYLALMNVALAVFNMLPGFPMDGGRVLRALLARTRGYARATKIAAEVGKVFAILLGLFGLFGPGSLFLVAIAFFIYLGASGEAQQTMMKAAFEGFEVRDIMTTADRVQTVDAGDSVAELVEQMFRERHTGYPVEHNDEIVGLVTLEDARAVRDIEREAYRVEEIMTTDLETIGPTASAMEAMERLQRNNIGRLLVYDDGEFVGLLTRSDLLTALNIIKEGGSVGRRPVPSEPTDESLSAERDRL